MSVNHLMIHFKIGSPLMKRIDYIKKKKNKVLTLFLMQSWNFRSAYFRSTIFPATKYIGNPATIDESVHTSVSKFLLYPSTKYFTQQKGPQGLRCRIRIFVGRFQPLKRSVCLCFSGINSLIRSLDLKKVL